MTRTLSSNALALISEEYGTKPLNVIEITWLDGTIVRYGDKTISNYCEGKVISIDTIDEVVKVDSSSSSVQVTITLDDIDGYIKDLLNKYDPHKRPCKIYQYYDDNSFGISDAFTLFEGELVSPITWDEHERTVVLTVLSKIYSVECGFTPEEGQFTGIPNELLGTPWPLGFGSVVHVPVVKAAQTVSGTSMTLFGVPDYSLTHKQKYYQDILASIKKSYSYYQKTLITNFFKRFYLVISPIKPYTVEPEGTFQVRAKNKTTGKISVTYASTDLIFALIAAKIIKEGDLRLMSTDETVLNVDGRSYTAYEFVGEPFELEIVNQNISKGFVAFTSFYDAKIVETKYARTIVETDKIKQRREDFANELEGVNKQVDAYLKEFDKNYADLGPDDPDRVNFQAKIDNYNKVKEGLAYTLEDYDLSLKYMENNLAVYENYSEEIKTMGNFIGEVKRKIEGLRQQYIEVSEQIDTIKKLQIDENNLAVDKIIVSGGEKFPQWSEQNPQEIDIRVNDLILHGKMEGRTFDIIRVEPRYRRPLLADRNVLDDDSYKYVWLKDQNLKLEGHYLLCLDSDGKQFITRVVTQTNNRCELELKEIPQLSRRHKKNLYKESDKTVKELREKLNTVLTGHETAEEVYQLGSLLPTGLSPEILEILNGKETDTYIISTKNEFESTASITFTYDGFESQRMLVSDLNNDDILRKIITTLPNIAQFKDDVEIADKKIKFKGKLLPLRPLRVNYIPPNEQSQPFFKFTVANTETTKVIFKVANKQSIATTIGINVITPNLIKLRLEALGFFVDDVVDVSPTPIEGQDKKIKIFKIFLNNSTEALRRQLAIEVIDREPTASVNLSGELFVEDVPIITVYTEVAGANEYTQKQRANILLDNSGYIFRSNEYKIVRERMGVLYSSLKFDTELDPTERMRLLRELVTNMNKYAEMVNEIYMPPDAVAEAYRKVSNKEYNKLMELELLSFIETIRTYQNYAVEPEIPKTKFYRTGEDIVEILEVSKHPLKHWFNGFSGLSEADLYDSVNSLPTTQAFLGQFGDLAILNGDYQEVYICNILPSTIHSVYGTRTIDGIKRFLPIPSRYYTKNENYSYGRYNCTIISLYRPLSDYVDERWDSDIYVSYTSSVGPNLGDIVNWLATTYTNLTMDTTNLNNIKAALENYPCNFVLFDKRDTLALIEDICWQSRCRSYVVAKKLYIQYLSTKASSVKTLTIDDVENKSLQLTFSETEEVVTKFVAKWRSNYRQEKDYKTILRYNIKKYGEIEREYNFFIYNEYSLVEKSATFWLIRKANTWKSLQFTTALQHLDLQTFDTITFDTTNKYVANSAVDGIIEQATYNSDSLTVQLKIWFPVRAGEMEPYQFAWPSDVSITTIYPTVEEVLEGLAGNYDNTRVPNNVEFDPTTVNAEYRPHDFGTKYLSDDVDTRPKDYIGTLKEFDYTFYEKLTAQDDFNINKYLQPSDNSINGDAPIPPNFENNVVNKTEIKPDILEPFIGRVIGLASKVAYAGDTIRGGSGDENIKTIEHKYKVQSPTGKIIEARQIVCVEDDVLPTGYPVYVLYDKSSNEYQMQPPVYAVSSGENDAKSS